MIKQSHFPSSLRNESKERVRKNTTWAALYLGRGFTIWENIYCLLTWSPYHAIWEDIGVKHRYKPCLPVWRSECKGHIFRVRPRRSEAYGTRVIVFPLCQIPSWNIDTCLMLRLCPGLLIGSKSAFSLSFYLYLSISLSPPPGWDISSRRAFKVFAQHFPSIFLSCIK